MAPDRIVRARSHAHAHMAKVGRQAPATQQSFPLPPLPPLPTPDRPERPRAPDSERPRVGTKTSRCVEPPSRWSSQIDASVTTASGVDLWTRESGSARSRAYARLRWGLRGSITRSPINAFSMHPSCHWHSHGRPVAVQTQTGRLSSGIPRTFHLDQGREHGRPSCSRRGVRNLEKEAQSAQWCGGRARTTSRRSTTFGISRLPCRRSSSG